jgi:hypothetical protein
MISWGRCTIKQPSKIWWILFFDNNTDDTGLCTCSVKHTNCRIFYDIFSTKMLIQYHFIIWHHSMNHKRITIHRNMFHAVNSTQHAFQMYKKWKTNNRTIEEKVIRKTTME